MNKVHEEHGKIPAIVSMLFLSILFIVLSAYWTNNNAEKERKITQNARGSQEKIMLSITPEAIQAREEKELISSNDKETVEEEKFTTLQSALESPDGTYVAITYGVNKNITASGLYPAEGIHIIQSEDGNVVWEGPGYYATAFLWSPDSRYLAITGMTRISSEIVIVDTRDFSTIYPPIPEDITSDFREFRPDPYFAAKEWLDGEKLNISYAYVDKKDQDCNGEYTFHIPKEEIDHIRQN